MFKNEGTAAEEEISSQSHNLSWTGVITILVHQEQHCEALDKMYEKRRIHHVYTHAEGSITEWVHVVFCTEEFLSFFSWERGGGPFFETRPTYQHHHQVGQKTAVRYTWDTAEEGFESANCVLSTNIRHLWLRSCCFTHSECICVFKRKGLCRPWTTGTKEGIGNEFCMNPKLPPVSDR